MLSQPQESLTLLTPPPNKFEDLAPTTMAFPQTDPTYFLVGSEEGPIYPCHRYDRAGAKAGVDARVSYRGHAAPVMSVSFHPARGPVDLGDLVLSSSLDWSVKLWKVRAPAATSTIVSESAGAAVAPLADIAREDVVYDAAWSPVRPGVFALVDGAGNLEIWDLTVETEIPVARISPSPLSAFNTTATAGGSGGSGSSGKDAGKNGTGNVNGSGGGSGGGGGGAGTGVSAAAANSAYRLHSLNKVAWEPGEGRRLATGGIEGVVSVFEVGPDLGGKEGVRNDEWASVKKLVARLEAAGGGAAAGL